MLKKILFIALCIAVLPFVVLAQNARAIISGNLKIRKHDPQKPNKFYFTYNPIYSDKEILIPIQTDNAGNFKVSIPIEGMQEVEVLGSTFDVNKKIVCDRSVVLLHFFVRSGRTLKVNFIKGDKLWWKFSGDFAAENNEFQKFNEVDRFYEYYGNNQRTKKSYAELKPFLLQQLRYYRTMRSDYFNKNQTSNTFAKEQAGYDQNYRIFEDLLNLIGSELNDSVLIDFCKAADIVIANKKAEGNNAYGEFIRSYSHFYLQSTTKKTITLSGISEFVKTNYSKVPQKDSIILSRLSSNEPISQSDRAYVREYITSFLEVKAIEEDLNSLLDIEDTYLRELLSTRFLLGKMQMREIIYLKEWLKRYNEKVTRADFKNVVLDTYNKRLIQFKRSKISKHSKIHNSDELVGFDVLSQVIDKHKGKVLYIDIWATWCGPCIYEMEYSAELRKRFDKKDVVFIYLCVQSPNQNRWLDLIAENKIEGENYFLNKKQSDVIRSKLNVVAIPRYLVVNKNGEIINSSAPAPSKAKAEKMLLDLL
jgi:thiol-disulfide isomerase/thioredoxin